MNLRESTRRYILLGLVVLVILGVVVSNVMASGQDEQFSIEDALYQQANQLASAGNFEEASVYINELLKTKPNSEAANYLGALIAVNTGEKEQAAILFQKTLDLNPYRVEEPMFMLQLGESFYQAERYVDARVVLTRCLETGWAPEEFPEYQATVADLLSKIENKL
ncbi:hypothetical protein CD30_13835 [Ureibacillus massiliensis 4400831 = CIP 108448 = CCUG 49529]|uniref:Uncharacterized protein n=1 Tax=Ureibacillus massiliensis 4400831 = CIP 108448 = CCUG 49529 TaxID=1211035 RepID=A0A0A3IZB2_9BACL|nr:tetratricopeptide repeat protein [Ureibacillus massiliensis]KGR90051.1 hypothetical protein CD30_13835 [Ureibacillus massiliensis 4400831 = CIP 108448 = CCUG 49529]